MFPMFPQLTSVFPTFADNHEVQPSPFPFRSHWHRRIDAHMAAGSCPPERRDASGSRNPPLPLRSHHAMRFALAPERLRPLSASHRGGSLEDRWVNSG